MRIEHIKTYWAIAPVVALALASCYLQGFWGAFGVFPFVHLTFQQMLSYSAIPFFGVVLSMALSMAIGAAASSPLRNWLGGGDKEVGAKLLTVHADVMLIVILVLGALLTYLRVPGTHFILAIGGVLLLMRTIGKSKEFASLTKEDRWRWLVFLYATVVCVISWAYGRTMAEEILSERKADAVCTIGDREETITWVGALGEYFFLLDSDRRVMMVTVREVKRVVWKERHPLRDWREGIR